MAYTTHVFLLKMALFFIIKNIRNTYMLENELLVSWRDTTAFGDYILEHFRVE